MIEIFKNFLKTVCLCCIVFYLCYHIFSGNYGIMSYAKIQNELIHKKIEYQNALNEIEKIQNKISRLKLANLDLDLFEEEFKKNTGYVSENEIVIFMKGNIDNIE